MINNKYFNITPTSGNYNSINVIEYTASTVYNKPSNLLYAYVVCIGGGGGGGGGAKSTGQVRGAGAGGGGALASRYLLESEISPTGETITIGVGGLGGAGRTGSNGSGNPGNPGSQTTFGSLIYADFGLGGDEGRINPATSSGAGGLILQSTPNFFKLSQDGGRGNAGGLNGNALGSANLSGNDVAGSEGGASGGNTVALNNSNGARGGIGIDYTGTTWNANGGVGTTGGNGENGYDNIVLQLLNEYPIVNLPTKGLGTGGGGGGNSTNGINNGGDGGDGGLYGAGGGGGGSAQSPMGGGNGGDGSQGLCIIVEYLS